MIINGIKKPNLEKNFNLYKFVDVSKVKHKIMFMTFIYKIKLTSRGRK